MANDILSNVWPEWRAAKRLGSGSYGVVYEAVRSDHGVESKAAVKVISIPSSESEIDSLKAEGITTQDQSKTYLKGIVDDFVSEIQLMESFKGTQNIVSVEDYKVVERTDRIGWDIFIRMELLTPFTSYISDQTLTEKQVITLGHDICSALELCGRKKVIHRDIKPQNIFVNEFGNFKLGDFGIARKLENVTGGLSQKGSPNYMAPEVAKGTKYTASVDQYSLGIVMYQLMNKNRLPFLDTDRQLLSPNERRAALERRMNGETLPPPCEASPAMADVILKACAYDPARRFSSPTELKKALIRVLNGSYYSQPKGTVPAGGYGVPGTEQDLAGSGNYTNTNAPNDDRTMRVHHVENQGGYVPGGYTDQYFNGSSSGYGSQSGYVPEEDKKHSHRAVLPAIVAVLSLLLLAAGVLFLLKPDLINTITGKDASDPKESQEAEKEEEDPASLEGNTRVTVANLEDPGAFDYGNEEDEEFFYSADEYPDDFDPAVQGMTPAYDGGSEYPQGVSPEDTAAPPAGVVTPEELGAPDDFAEPGDDYSPVTEDLDPQGPEAQQPASPQQPQQPASPQQPAAPEESEDPQVPEAPQEPEEEEPEPVLAVMDLKKGDLVCFGTFEQNNQEDGWEPLFWDVIDTSPDGSRALLLSRYSLTNMQYNPDDENAGWKESGLRDWTNQLFFTNVFTVQNMSVIVPVSCYDTYGFDGFSDDEADYVFCLSRADVEKLFPDPADRTTTNTPYAEHMMKQQMLLSSHYPDTREEVSQMVAGWGQQYGEHCSWWWLKDPGCYIHAMGEIKEESMLNDLDSVRPALWIELAGAEEAGVRLVSVAPEEPEPEQDVPEEEIPYERPPQYIDEDPGTGQPEASEQEPEDTEETDAEWPETLDYIYDFSELAEKLKCSETTDGSGYDLRRWYGDGYTIEQQLPEDPEDQRYFEVIIDGPGLKAGDLAVGDPYKDLSYIYKEYGVFVTAEYEPSEDREPGWGSALYDTDPAYEYHMILGDSDEEACVVYLLDEDDLVSRIIVHSEKGTASSYVSGMDYTLLHLKNDLMYDSSEDDWKLSLTDTVLSDYMKEYLADLNGKETDDESTFAGYRYCLTDLDGDEIPDLTRIARWEDLSVPGKMEVLMYLSDEYEPVYVPNIMQFTFEDGYLGTDHEGHLSVCAGDYDLEEALEEPDAWSVWKGDLFEYTDEEFELVSHAYAYTNDGTDRYGVIESQEYGSYDDFRDELRSAYDPEDSERFYADELYDCSGLMEYMAELFE